MKYIYDKEGKYIDYVQTDDIEMVKLQYPSMFILNEYIGEYGIVENGEIREKTRLDRIKASEEQLQEGEYIKGNEIISVEKPNNFHLWNSEKNEWTYDAELEKSFLEEEIGALEGKLSGLYDELDKAVARKLKMREKQLNEEIEKLNGKIENKYKRYEELEG